MSDRLEYARNLLQKTVQSWSPDPTGDTVPFSLGIAEIERHLSAKAGFATSLHELYSQIGCGGREFYATLFARLFFNTDNRIIFWITSSSHGDNARLYTLSFPPDLQARLHLITPKRERDTLWCFEECLASGQACAVIAEVPHLDLLSSRRLQLACEKGQSLGLALCQNSLGLQQKTAARTRWRVAGAPHQHWKLELLGGHGVRPGCWNVKYDETALSLSLAPPSRH